MGDSDKQARNDSSGSDGGGGRKSTDALDLSFDRRKHVTFYLRHLSMLPPPYSSADTQRMTLAYFALSALDIMDAVQEKLKPEETQEFIDWIYEQQCTVQKGGGFRGGPAVGSMLSCIVCCDTSTNETSPLGQTSCSPIQSIGCGNLAMTYTALLNLAILRDDFSRLDRNALLYHLGSLQQPNGSFSPSIGHLEPDCRFVFCAFAICAILGDWSAIDVESSIHFLLATRSYDGAFGQSQGQESQGGYTYCVVASLALAGRLDALEPGASSLQQRQASSLLDLGSARLAQWLLSRQQSGTGFNGRIGKLPDTCYSFWCGAAIQVLGHHGVIDTLSDVSWILSAQSPVGGISKTPGEPPDLMHSYLATVALAMHAHDKSQLPQALPLPLPATAPPTADTEIYESRKKIETDWKAETGQILTPVDPVLNITLSTKQWLQAHLTTHPS